LARRGLIFTRSYEGTQPGQTEHGIRYHVPPCWVLGGELAGGKSVTAGECAGDWAVRVTLCILLFVLCILLTRIAEKKYKNQWPFFECVQKKHHWQVLGRYFGKKEGFISRSEPELAQLS